MTDGGQRRRQAALVVAGAIVIAAGAIVVALVADRSASRNASRAAGNDPNGRVPTSVAIPAELSEAGATGIAKDGWTGQQAEVQLAGGPAVELVVRGTTPVLHQFLVLMIGRITIAAVNVTRGRFQVRALAPPSYGNREIRMRFAQRARLPAPDSRFEAARLSYVGPAGGPTPAAVAFPRSQGTGRTHGVFADGWATRRSSFLLAGGGPATLTIAGKVPAMRRQHLRIDVDRVRVFDDDVNPGSLDLRLPLTPSRADRYVELEFTREIHLADPDPRTASALLMSLRLAPLAASTTLDFPGSLAGSHGSFPGIYPDGWARRDVRFAIGAGGPLLRVELEDLIQDQTASFVVDGRRYATRPVRVGTTTYVLRLARPAGVHLVSIHFAKIAPISSDDRRPAAALLKVAATS